MIPGPSLRGDHSGDLGHGRIGEICECGGVRFELGEEVRRASGGQYVSLPRGGCEDRQLGAGLAGQRGVWRYQLDDYWARDGVAVAV